MPSLSRALLKEPEFRPALNGRPVTVGALHSHPVRILQFGEGNFLRAFLGWMVDMLNSQGLFDGSIAVVQPIPAGRAADLRAQEGLYTVLLRGIVNGAVSEEARIVTAISDVYESSAEWDEVLAIAASPDIEVVVSNTTEAGICYHPEARPERAAPVAFAAKLTALLYERFRRFHGDETKGWLFLPCELLESNGERLKECIASYAVAWELEPEFAAWIAASCTFLNTLVDRIVSGYPADEARQLCDALGYEDKMLVIGEPYHLFVIEGSARFSEALPFHRAGLNVVWTDNLAEYRNRKVRILNGAHVAIAPIAALAGLETVREAVEHPVIGTYLRELLFEEIVPAFGIADEPAAAAYARVILERFRNPCLRHEVLAICVNAVSKWRVRILPSLLAYHQLRKELPRRIVYSLAALIRFYDMTGPGGGDEPRGGRANRDYPIRDEPSVVAHFRGAWNRFRTHSSTARLVDEVLADEWLWERNLSQIPGLPDLVNSMLTSILGDKRSAGAGSCS